MAAAQHFPVFGPDRRADYGRFPAIERSLAGTAGRLLLQTPPLYLSTLAIIAGDALGNFRVFMPSWTAVAAAIISAAFFLCDRRLPGIVVALFGLVSAATLPVNQLLNPAFASQTIRGFPDGARVTLEGWLIRQPEPQEHERKYLYIDVQNGALSPAIMAPVTGRVRVTVLGQQDFRVGDKVRVSGKIRFPRNEGDEDEFDYRAWLMRQGIAATIVAAPSRNDSHPVTVIGHHDVFPDAVLQAVRERVRRLIDVTLAYPESAEMRALIIGDRSGIDERLREPFALTGMAHLLVISGLHLGLVASGVFLLVRLVIPAFPALMALGYTNKIAAGAALAAVGAYAGIAGGHVSTIRALVMVFALALAILLDRSRELLASLALAALLICIAIPGSTADIGFQLSFASVGVILLGMRRFNSWWRWRYANPLSTPAERLSAGSAAKWVCGYVAVSFWAMIGTAPLTAFHFNQFSLVGMVANPIVVPIIGFGAVVCGLAAAACSFVYLPLASRILVLAGRCAACGTMLARCFFTWPLAWVRMFTPTPLEMIIVYGFILLWLSAPVAGTEVLRAMHVRDPEQNWNNADPRRNGHGKAPSQVWRVVAACILLAAVVVDAGWWSYQRFLNSELRVTFLSVGEGDAAVVRFPGARVLLIDGGGEFRGTFDPGERIVAPYLWAHKIMHVDYVALSHPDRDHFGGLTFIVRNFSPSEFWTSGAEGEDSSYQELLDAVKASGAHRWICDSAAHAMTIAGVSVRCLGPLHGVAEAKRNNSSMVLRLAYGRAAFLFPGDVEVKGERELIAAAADVRATILKVPHHGSRTSSSLGFIQAVHPGIAVMSLGYLNRFHFPAPEVIQRYEDAGAEVLRTDDDGAISIVADTKGYRLRTFRRDENAGSSDLGFIR